MDKCDKKRTSEINSVNEIIVVKETMKSGKEMLGEDKYHFLMNSDPSTNNNQQVRWMDQHLSTALYR